MHDYNHHILAFQDRFFDCKARQRPRFVLKSYPPLKLLKLFLIHVAAVDLVCLNDLKLIGTVFSLKATAPLLATSWIESIKQTQVCM